MTASSPYSGRESKLILAFDVGTTHSAISYCILSHKKRSEPKEITMVASMYPGHGSSKIPSVIYYDNNGVVQAVGAETLDEGINERAEEKNWTRTESFKMHLRPSGIRDSDVSFCPLLPLPVDKSAVVVLGDYLKYLLRCSKTFLEDTQPDGKVFWTSVEQTTEFVITYSNGWGPLQQLYIQKAAVLAGLIPDNPAGKKRLSFVSEGDANLYFATHHGLPKEITEGGEGVIIVDAGGRTINISSYAHDAYPTNPNYRPITPTRCYPHGSICVSNNLRVFLTGLLAGSDLVQDIDHIVQCFENGTKLRFRNPEEVQFIKFGRPTVNHPDFNIRFGQLKLHGTDVATFFEPSVKCIIDAIQEIKAHSVQPVTHVVLVGGFAANNWLYQSIDRAMAPLKVSVLRPHNSGIAVCIGAIFSKLDLDLRQQIL